MLGLRVAASSNGFQKAKTASAFLKNYLLLDPGVDFVDATAGVAEDQGMFHRSSKGRTSSNIRMNLDNWMHECFVGSKYVSFLAIVLKDSPLTYVHL